MKRQIYLDHACEIADLVFRMRVPEGSVTQAKEHK